MDKSSTNLPYLGKKGEQLTNSLIRNLKSSFKENLKFKTNKLLMFCYSKGNMFVEQKSNVIYRITCPGCFQKCVGKTDHNLIARLDKHGKKVGQPK